MKNEYIKILNRRIGKDYPPTIVAEMSGNHNQSLDKALKIVEEVAAAGAHALKLQTYTADTMTLDICNNDFLINDPESLWNGKYLYNLYNEAHTPWEWHKPIFQKCKKLGLICFSTPFDLSAVDFLEELDVPCYKIASFENTDLQLIKKAASTGKPLIISTGIADVSDIYTAVCAARESGCNKLILLKCVSSYPAKPENINLKTIPHMEKMFDCQIGLSDHSNGIGVSVASIGFGVTMIEKHFTLDRSEGGIDAAFSMEPDEMRLLVKEAERAWKAIGKINYNFNKEEQNSAIFKRSLYVVQDIKQGEVFTQENMRSIRPGFGLNPKYYEIILGKYAKTDIPRGTPLCWKLVG